MHMNLIESLVRDYTIRIEDIKAKQDKQKNKILFHYKDRTEYINGLNYHLIEKAGDINFPKFYAAYEKIFVNEEEKESYNGFEEVLKFNGDLLLQNKYGPFKEVIIYCTNPEEDEVIGGINFSTYSIPFKFNGNHIFGTSHIFYLFVDPEYRSLNLGTELIKKARNYSELLISDWSGVKNDPMMFEKNQIIVFCEQNYPEKMTVYQYWLDNVNSATDQFDRLGWWNKKGFRRLSFDYIQPSLDPNNRPCTYLSLNANVDFEDSLPSELILEHIRRFFAISVLKGIDLENESSYRNIEKQLKLNPHIYFEDYIDFGLIKRTIFNQSYSEISPDTLIGELLKKR